ncbi:MAG: C40 family peptidase [Candidatus Hodarchaeales archaeon]|jgi:cell wall-associated NlpC family hydrolase
MSQLSYRKYIGIPFKSGGRDFSGVDCYGVVVLVYREEKNIYLWDTSNYNMNSYAKDNTMLSNYHENWTVLDVEDLQELDILFFAVDTDLPNIPTHIALYIGENKMLHCMSWAPTYIR